MRQDFEAAKQLIDKMLEDVEEEEQEEVPAWVCDCGEEVDEGFFVCWACGAEYQSSGD